MKKLTLGLVVLSLLASCSPSILLDDSANTPVNSDNRAVNTNITLMRANSTTTTPYGIYSVSRSFYLKVKNLSSTKSVFVHHEKSNGTWEDIPATYMQNAEDGYEVWTASTGWNSQYQATNPNSDQFCLKLVANGVTYWDNNSGANYKLAQHGGELLGPGVKVYQNYGYTYKAYDTQKAHFYGAIDIQNLALNKKVTIVYTLDSWATQKTAQATYNNLWTPSYAMALPSPNAYGVENWTFDVDTGAAVANIFYAIKYEVGGQTYWDNNFGANYKLVVRF